MTKLFILVHGTSLNYLLYFLGRPANVAYHEMTIPADFPIHLRKYIPNISYRTVFLDEAGNFPPLKIVGLVATRLIQEGDELYSTYISVVDES